jgi:hypothetical protein
MIRSVSKIALASLLMFTVTPEVAWAQNKNPCQVSFEAVQTLRDTGKPVEALQEAAKCQSLCAKDKYFADRCAQWAPEIRESIPTIVLDAHDGSGASAPSTRVFMDGKLLQDNLDGRPQKVDPGSHVFRFELAGQAPKETTELIKAGEKNRSIAISFTAPPPPPPPPPSASVVVPPPSPSPTNTVPPPPASSQGPVVPPPAPEATGVPAWAWVVGGVGLASAGVGIGFLVASVNGQADITTNCKDGGAYSAADCGDLRDANNTKQILAGTLSGVGGIALLVSGIAIATSPRAAKSARKRSVQPNFGLAPGRSWLGLSGTF